MMMLYFKMTTGQKTAYTRACRANENLINSLSRDDVAAQLPMYQIEADELDTARVVEAHQKSRFLGPAAIASCVAWDLVSRAAYVLCPEDEQHLFNHRVPSYHRQAWVDGERKLNAMGIRS
jgi:hypothetical protein